MGRGNWQTSEFGIAVSKEEFTDQAVVMFGNIYADAWTIDELLLHPREACRFCDDFRRHHGYWDVPDDIVLRVILNRRKNG